MKIENVNLTPVFVGHALNSTLVSLRVGRFKIYGKSTAVVDIKIPTVILLSDDSLPDFPQRQRVNCCASEDFSEAASKLITTGQPFYTMLRPNWNCPAMLWEISHKNEIIVRSNGDAEDVWEGGYNYLFDVILCDVDQEKGKLEWEVNMAVQSASLQSGSDFIAEPHTDHVRDYGVVGEDILSLLSERGVKIIYLPEVSKV